MNLISREVVKDIIKAEFPERGMWEIEGDTAKETVCEVCVDLDEKLSKLPSAFEGMTYKDVVKAVFPNAVIRTDDSGLIVEVLFSNEVWNAPYKGVSE